MKATLSPLKLVDLSVSNLVCHFIPPQGKIDDIGELFGAYDIDINFTPKKGEAGNIFQIFMKAEINSGPGMGSQKEGYTMLIECVGTFDIAESTVLKNGKRSMALINPALGMVLNFLRTKLADFTAHFPCGIYWLPSIDLNDLVSQKQQTLAPPKKASKKK